MLEVYTDKGSDYKIIIQANVFSRASNEFTYNQRLFIMLIQNQISKNSLIKNEFILDLKELGEIKGKNTFKKDISVIENNFEELLATKIILISKDEKYYKGINLFEKLELYQDKIKVKLTDSFQNLLYPNHNLNNLDRKVFDMNYTKLVKNNLVQLKSNCARKLYEILCSYCFGGQVFIETDNLRLMLGFSSYKDINIDFNEGVFLKVKGIEHTKYKESWRLNELLKKEVLKIQKLDDSNKVTNIKNLSFSVAKRGKKTWGYFFNFFNTNGVKNDFVERLSVGTGLSKYQSQSILLEFGETYKIGFENFIKFLNKNVEQKPNKIWVSKKTLKKIKNKAGFLWDLHKKRKAKVK